MYSVQSNTEHRVTISGVGSVQALDEYIIQCVYSVLGDVISRAMLSSTPSPLQVSLEVRCALIYGVYVMFVDVCIL